MGDEAKDRYTLNIDCRQSKHRDTHSIVVTLAGCSAMIFEAIHLKAKLKKEKVSWVRVSEQ